MDKRSLIIQSAMEQFTEKGYHQATIQDIADAAGIAKGGIYFYFKSKEDLVCAVFTQYHDRMFKSVSDAAARYAFDPREGLIQQIMVQFNELSSHSGFLTIFSRGKVDISDEIKQIAMQMRTKFFVWFRDQIIKVYGPLVEPHAFDLSALMTSLLREYIGFILMNGAQLPIREVSELIVARVEDAIHGILNTKKGPVLTTMVMKSIFPDADIREGTDTAWRLYAAIDALLERFGEIPLSVEDQLLVQQMVDVIKDETRQSNPRHLVMKGMLVLVQEKAGGEQWQEMLEINKMISEFS